MDRKDELLSVQREYIEHLKEWLDGITGFLIVHNIHCTEQEYQNGLRLRTRIEELEKEIENE